MKFDEEAFKKEFQDLHCGKYEYIGYENGKVMFKCKIHNKYWPINKPMNYPSDY